jgi:GNAT superfamily N-acetyltransferase
VIVQRISRNLQSVGIMNLQGGANIAYRRIRESDGPALQRFHDTLSPTTIHQRFFGAMPHLGDAMAYTFTHVDGKDRVALVALNPTDAMNLIGVARYDRIGTSRSVEYACVVTDRWQGHGIGTSLTAELIRVARGNGFHTMEAIILADNRPMLEVLINLGLPYTLAWEDTTTVLSLDISGDQQVNYSPPQTQS